MAFPEPPLLDDFNRANENPLSQGGLWNTSGTNLLSQTRLLTTSNEAEAGATANRRGSFRPEDYGPDVSFAAVMRGWPDNNREFHIFLAMDVDANPTTPDGYSLRIEGQGTPPYAYPVPFDWTLVRFANGGETTIATALNVDSSTGDSVGFWRDGDRLSGWLNETGTWVEILTVDDTTYAGQVGKFAIMARATWPGFDAVSGSTYEAFIPQIYRRAFG